MEVKGKGGEGGGEETPAPAPPLSRSSYALERRVCFKLQEKAAAHTEDINPRPSQVKAPGLLGVFYPPSA